MDHPIASALSLLFLSLARLPEGTMGSHTQSHEEMTEESTFFSITTSRRIGMRSTFCQITQMRSPRQMFLIRVVIVPQKKLFSFLCLVSVGAGVGA